MPAETLAIHDLAASITRETAREIEAFRQRGRAVRVEALLIGESPEAARYVAERGQLFQSAGVEYRARTVGANEPVDGVLERLRLMSEDEATSGILVAAGSGAGITRRHCAEELPPQKDVEGIHPLNLGLTLTNPEAGAPLPPLVGACLGALASHDIDLYEKSILIHGPQKHFAVPLAAALTARHASVVTVPLQSTPPAAMLGSAGVVICAGSPRNAIRADAILPEALLYDLGAPGPGGDGHPTGAGAFDPSVMEHAGALLPAGAIAPLEHAMLLQNLVLCTRTPPPARREGLSRFNRTRGGRNR